MMYAVHIAIAYYREELASVCVKKNAKEFADRENPQYYLEAVCTIYIPAHAGSIFLRQVPRTTFEASAEKSSFIVCLSVREGNPAT